MLGLRELQQGFVAELLGGEVSMPRAAIVSDAFAGDRRLQVYRNNVFTTLTRALTEVYPVITRLVGEGFFRYAAQEYVVRFPSRSANLHEFGGSFAEFLCDFPAVATLPYLPDVARLEWALHEAFHAPDHPPLKVQRLAALPPDEYGRLKFRLHPSVRLLASAFPILRIWEVNQEGFPGEPHVDLRSGKDRLLVRRRELDVQIEALTHGEFELLGALAQGATLEAAFAAVRPTADAFDPVPCFQRWALQGTLVDAA